MKRPVSTPKHSLNRRSLVVGALQLGFTGALAARLRHLQITQADQYRLLAEENRINIRLIAPERGEIYDRNGVFLARNEQSYRITLVKEDAGDNEGIKKVGDKWIWVAPEGRASNGA